MDQNPPSSSPFQHHLPPSSEPNGQQPPQRTPVDGKLNLPTLAAPPACPSPISTSSRPWREDGLHGGYRKDWPEPGPSRKTASYTASSVSTSRCPTPTTPAFDLSSLTPPPTILATPATSPPPNLLTSEPLNRSVSSANTVTSIFPPSASRITKKRERSQSVPDMSRVYYPELKKHKSDHHSPEPTSQETHVPSERAEYRYGRKEPLPNRFLRAARAPKEWLPVRSSVRPRLLFAIHQPPINPSTLKSLDANEILKNPQLRHDLLFDALAFRPVSSNNTDVVTAAKGDDPNGLTDPKSTTAKAEQYWESIAAELKEGCRCTRWTVKPASKNGNEPEVTWREKACICGRWMPTCTESTWWTVQTQGYASRIPELIRTLRDILISLMGSTTPCPNHFAHSFSREALERHERSCPTVTHALVPELYHALDPEFLTIQVRRRVFNLGLFGLLGDAMKVHCAPVRDAMVDDMVRTAMSGEVASGLRKCFDCVEVMKLDIANHQVHALRPFLWTSAAQHESASFVNRLTASDLTLQTSATQAWIKAASVRVLRVVAPSERADLLVYREELVFRSVVEGFVDLVFSDWTEPSASWPPPVSRRVAGSTGVQLVENGKLLVTLPESFRMDARRIKNFHAEVVDLAILHMIVLAYRGALVAVHRTLTPKKVRACMAKAKEDVEHVLDSAGTILPSSGHISPLAIRLANRAVRPDAKVGDVPHNSSPDELRRIRLVAEQLDKVLLEHLKPTSVLYQAAATQVRNSVTRILTNSVLATRLDPTSSFFEPVPRPLPVFQVSLPFDGDEDAIMSSETTHLSATAAAREELEGMLAKDKEDEEDMMDRYAMGAVKEDIRALAKKMEKIVDFNLGVFGEMYAEKGMVVGA